MGQDPVVRTDCYRNDIHHWIDAHTNFSDSDGFNAEKFFQNARNSQREKIAQHTSAAAAFGVSQVLRANGLVSHFHISVDALLRDMKRNGWRTGNKIEWDRITHLPKGIPPGTVLVWERLPAQTGSAGERHIGFYLDTEYAVSIHPQFHKPYQHHITFGVMGNDKKRKPVRKVVQILIHPSFAAKPAA